MRLLDVPSHFSPDSETSQLLRAAIGVRTRILDAFAPTVPSASVDRLARRQLNRVDAELQLAAVPYDVVGFLGHGAPNAILGSGLQPIMDTFVAPSLVQRRVFCLTACFSGQQLAPALRQAGAVAVFAYADSLIFDHVSLPLIVQCATVADTSALAGRSPPEIEALVRLAYENAIEFSQTQANVSLEQHLRHALHALVALF